jgi:hypothetical protein
MSVNRNPGSPVTEAFLRHPRRTSKPASFQGQEGLGFKKIAAAEKIAAPKKLASPKTAMQSWVKEAGQELRDVESEIGFFRNHVDATFATAHGLGANQ